MNLSDDGLLDEVRSHLGVQEVRGPAANPEVLGFFADVGHPEIENDDTTAWCAAFVGSCLKRRGYPIPPKETNLLARTYATYGVATTPGPGAIAVIPRGNSGWMGHVFVIEEIKADGRWQTIGGNQGREGYGKVSRAVVDPRTTRVLGVRRPVEASAPALRKAGSTEIVAADGVEKAAIGTAGTVAAVASSPDADMADATQYIGFLQQLKMAATEVMMLARANWWVCLILLCIAVWLGARWWKRHRVQRAASGLPLSTQV